MRPYLFIFFVITFTIKTHSFDVSLIGNKEAKIFAKCYHQFTRSPLPHDHEYLSLIKNQTKTGKELCIDFLEDISFVSNKLPNPNNIDHMKTLKTFNDLHRSWFPDQSFHAVETQRSLGDFFDSGEPAYFYTRSLFDPVYSDPRSILSGKKRLHALRVDESGLAFERSKFYLHEPRGLGGVGGGGILSRTLPFGSVTCDKEALKDLNSTYNNFYNSPSEESAQLVRDQKGLLDQNNCVGGSLMDELGADAINNLGFIVGMEEREILLDESHFLYTSNFKGNHFQGELRNTKLIAEYFPLFKYIHHDQVCDEPLFHDNKEPIYLPIKMQRCQDMFAVSSDQTTLGDPKINVVNESLETYPFIDESGEAYIFPQEGFNTYSKLNIPRDKTIFNAQKPQWDLSGNIDTGTNRPGAGALGSMSYFLLNSNNIINNDGYFRLNRRWAQHAISDFLCREIPVLSPSDITSNTQIMETELIGPAPGFRGDVTCMTCHVTMDLAARTTRNIQFGPMTGGDKGPKGSLNGNAQINYEKPSLYHRPNIGMHPDQIMARIKPSLHKDALGDNFLEQHETYYWESGIKMYQNSEPRGAFVFKDFYEGTFIKEPILGVSGLAAQFLATNDFYGCIAKRYLSYLTGYEVTLSPPNPDIDEFKTDQQKEVESFHRELTVFLKNGTQVDGKSDPQTMKGLINKIIRSKFFFEEINND